MEKSEVTGVFADRLSDLIDEKKKKKITLQDIAKETGILKGSLSKYQNNEAEIRIFNLVKLAEYFGVSVDYLLGLTEARNPIKDKDSENLRIACDYTNLNEKAIYTIKKPFSSEVSFFNEPSLNVLWWDSVIHDETTFNQKKIEIINEIICNIDFEKYISALSEIALKMSEIEYLCTKAENEEEIEDVITRAKLQLQALAFNADLHLNSLKLNYDIKLNEVLQKIIEE